MSDDTAPVAETDETEEGTVAALPGDGLRESIVDDLRRRIGDALIDSHIAPNDDLWVRVRSDAWLDAAKALFQAGFRFFSFLSAIDWLPSPYGKGEEEPETAEGSAGDEADAARGGSEADEPAIEQGVTGGDTRLQVFARVTDLDRHVGVTVKVDVPDDHPVLESWVEVYAGANWHERECHEMFGIGFDGHPDLRNIYLPTEFEGHPLRKDFPLVARMVKPWPGIVDVEAMPEQDDDGEGS